MFIFLSPVYREGNRSSENLNDFPKWKFHTCRDSPSWNGNQRVLTVHRVSLPRSLELIPVYSKYRLGSNGKFQKLNDFVARRCVYIRRELSHDKQHENCFTMESSYGFYKRVPIETFISLDSFSSPSFSSIWLLVFDA